MILTTQRKELFRQLNPHVLAFLVHLQGMPKE